MTLPLRAKPASEVDDLHDLVSLLGEAYRVAAGELGALDAVEVDAWPVPDDVLKVCREHAAMRATLARVKAAASTGIQGRIVATYRKAAAEEPPTKVGPPSVPVLDEVVEAMDRVRESLRRLYLSSSAARAALDDVPGGWEP